MKKINILNSLIVFSILNIAAIQNNALALTTAASAHTINPGKSWDGNPLKGFATYGVDWRVINSASYPMSMEFLYMPVNKTLTGKSSTGVYNYDWSKLESQLTGIANNGRQAVIRYYLEYPDSPTGVPQFLIDGGLVMTGISPNYEDLNLREALKSFIAAYGAKYDGDKRIAFLQVGILGSWGEWHSPSPSAEVSYEVLNAFNAAFKKTPFSGRYPVNALVNLPKMGIHDDSFCYESYGFSWTTMEGLINAGIPDRWKTAPFGGELRPEVQQTIFSTALPWVGGNNNDWVTCVSKLHPTYMLCYSCNEYIDTTTNQSKTNSIIAQHMMGYDFRVTTAYYNNSISRHSALNLTLDIQNIGAAPFYYDHTTWPIAVGVKNSTGSLIKSWNTTWDLNTFPADSSTNKSPQFSITHGLPIGNYNICVKVINPLLNGHQLGFANLGQTADGWLDLGSFNVSQ